MAAPLREPIQIKAKRPVQQCPTPYINVHGPLPGPSQQTNLFGFTKRVELTSSYCWDSVVVEYKLWANLKRRAQPTGILLLYKCSLRRCHNHNENGCREPRKPGLTGTMGDIIRTMCKPVTFHLFEPKAEVITKPSSSVMNKNDWFELTALWRLGIFTCHPTWAIKRCWEISFFHNIRVGVKHIRNSPGLPLVCV